MPLLASVAPKNVWRPGYPDGRQTFFGATRTRWGNLQWRIATFLITILRLINQSINQSINQEFLNCKVH